MREGLNPHFVSQYSEVFEIALNYDEAEMTQALQAKETVMLPEMPVPTLTTELVH